jgi:hypothetical protein
MPAVAYSVEQFAVQLGGVVSVLPTLCGGVLGLCAGLLTVKMFEGVAAFRG